MIEIAVLTSEDLKEDVKENIPATDVSMKNIDKIYRRSIFGRVCIIIYISKDQGMFKILKNDTGLVVPSYGSLASLNAVLGVLYGSN